MDFSKDPITGERRDAEYCSKCDDHYIPGYTKCGCKKGGSLYEQRLIKEAAKYGMKPVDYALYKIKNKNELSEKTLNHILPPSGIKTD